MWQCKHCETQNDDQSKFCIVCNSSRAEQEEEAAREEKKRENASIPHEAKTPLNQENPATIQHQDIDWDDWKMSSCDGDSAYSNYNLDGWSMDSHEEDYDRDYYEPDVRSYIYNKLAGAAKVLLYIACIIGIIIVLPNIINSKAKNDMQIVLQTNQLSNGNTTFQNNSDKLENNVAPIKTHTDKLTSTRTTTPTATPRPTNAPTAISTEYTDLARYLCTSMDDFVHKFDNMTLCEDDPTVALEKYSNGVITVVSVLDCITEIELVGASEYCICGIYVGLNKKEAHEILKKAGWKWFSDIGLTRNYEDSEGKLLEIISRDGRKKVDEVSVRVVQSKVLRVVQSKVSDMFPETLDADATSYPEKNGPIYTTGKVNTRTTTTTATPRPTIAPTAISRQYTDLTRYLCTSMYTFVHTFNGMKACDSTDGVEYSNGVIKVYSPLDLDCITYMKLISSSSYCICDVHVNQDIKEAENTLTRAGWYLIENSDGHRYYEDSEGNIICILTREGKRWMKFLLA